MSGELRRSVLAQEAGKKDLERTVSTIAFLIIVPIIMALAGAATPDLYKAHGGWSVAAIWAPITLVYFLVWWRANPSSASMWTLLVENEAQETRIAELEQDVGELEESLDLAFALAALNYATRHMLVRYSGTGIASAEELRESLSEMMAPLYLEGETFFGFGGSERWNFAVYLYSSRRDQLIPVWREKARNHPSEGSGRSWHRGEGHVGKAFVNGQSIITGDASHPDVAQLSAAPLGRARDYDIGLYRSFASIPIGPMRDGEQFPCGVLVATSDRVGRFDKENTLVLAHIADVIAALITLTSVEFDTLPDPRPAIVQSETGRGDRDEE